MPLKRGSSRATISRNIREMHKSRIYRKVARTKGKARANKVAVAAAYSAARRRR